MNKKTVAVVLATFGVGYLTGFLVADYQPYPETIHLNTQGKVIEGKLERKMGKLAVYRISVEDRREGVRIQQDVYRYGDYLFPTAFVLKDGKVVNANNVKKEKIPANTAFLDSIVEDFKRQGINLEFGKGKQKIYVVFDALCPFCARAFKEEFPKLTQKYKVVLVPFPVHGEDSINAFACIFTEVKEGKKTLPEALGEEFDRFLNIKTRADYQKLKNHFKTCSKDPKIVSLLKKVHDELIANGVVATPTFFVYVKNPVGEYSEPNSYYKMNPVEFQTFQMARTLAEKMREAVGKYKAKEQKSIRIKKTDKEAG